MNQTAVPPAEAIEDRDESSVVRRLGSGVGWAVAGTSISQGAALLGSILAARLLGREFFGALAIVQSTGMAAATIASLGLGVVATRYVSACKESDPARVGRILALCSVVSSVAGLPFALALFAFADSVVRLNATAPALGGLLRITSIYVYFYTLNGFQMGALAGFEAFKRLAVVSAIHATGSLLLTFVLTSAFGLQGAVVAFAASAVLVWIVQHLALRAECRKRRIRIDYRNAFAEKEILSSFTLPCVLSAIAGNAAIWGSSIVVARGPSGLLEIGAFQAAFSLRNFILFLPAQATRVASPMLTSLWSMDRDRVYSKVFWMNLRLTTVVAALAAGALLLVGPAAMRLFGREFGGGARILAILAGAAVVEVAACSLYQVLLSHDRMWLQAGISALWSLTLVSVTVYGHNRMGAAALSFAYVAAWVISAGLYGMAAWRLIPRASRYGDSDPAPFGTRTVG